MRQQQILEVAASNPEATIEEIALQIPTVSPDLVENVLEEYGDPGDDASSNTDDDTKPATGDNPVNADEDPDKHNLESTLTAKQQQVIQTIAEHPSATQQEIAEQLDVSAPTISNRVNSIEGFNWEDRHKLVATVQQNGTTPPTTKNPKEETEEVTATNNVDNEAEPPNMHSSNPDQTPTDEQLAERVSALEDQIETIQAADETAATLTNPDLTLKVMHACLHSDDITKDEELDVLKAFLK